MKQNHKQKKQQLTFQTQKQTQKRIHAPIKNIFKTKNNILSTAKNINNNITKNQDYRQNNKPTKIFQPTHFIK